MQVLAPAERVDRAGRAEADDLVGVVRELAACRTLDDVVDIVRRAARRLTGADGATFVLRDADTCRYVDEDAISPLWKGRVFPISQCVSGWAMVHRQAVAISDVFQDDRIPHDAYRPTFVRSLVMVPIRTEEPVGAIGTYWSTERTAEPHEVEVLQALADSTSVAMENVRLYAELEARVEARTAELARANDELRELAAAVAHDIRSPLLTVQGFAQLLESNYGDELSAGGRQAAELLRGSADNLSEFVADLLDYLAAGTRTIEPEPVEMTALMDAVLERLAGEITAHHAAVAVTGSPALTGDRVLLGQALQNLVSNAIAYTPASRQPVIVVDLAADGDGWELSVTDNGDGIAPDEREAVVLPFRRGSSARGHPGTGFGLALCRKVAEHHGGALVIADAPGGGSRIAIRVPPVRSAAG